jgi:P4 family phage/plasmid primase-like protien
MSNFTKYLAQFTKNTVDYQTHLSFGKGKYNVPDEKHDEFYKMYLEAIKNGESLTLIEKISNSNFAFFLDLETPKKHERGIKREDVEEIIKVTKETIKEYFKGENVEECIVSRRMDKYHVNFYNIVVNNEVGMLLSKKVVEKCNDDIKVYIDTSVYRTGLRMFGSRKSKEESTVYKMYDIESDKEMGDPSDDLLMRTMIRRKVDVKLTEMVKEFSLKNDITQTKSKKKIQVKGVTNNNVVDEISRLLMYFKDTNASLSNFKMEINRLCATQNKAGVFCYYVSLGDRYCVFKEREHARESSPVYMEISINGVYIKCYDSDCIARRYPEGGLKLPENFSEEYPQLYMSMSTKYWNTDVKMTDEIKRQMELSLSGSHYQIAKAVFEIYKSYFRVDDIKNTEWYEFEGDRWKKSYNMNILLSEEFPKYYQGIKISDTSIKVDSLQEFLVNDDKINANLRNQMIDSIISKMENVSFKNNVMSQIVYLFKAYDADFYKNLDENPYLVGFKNGIYDFDRMVFRRGVQSDYITFSTGYDYIDYDENNEYVKEIYDFLGKIITNKKVREYTLKVLGKSLVGIPDERFYLWTGLSGANGKSTLINFLENALGDYITSVDVSLLTNKRTGSSNASPDIVRLRGKRMFTFQEPEHNDRLRTGILKQFTGGDTIIARELFKAPVSFKLQGTMIMCCNDLPAVTSIDGGTWRRIRVVEFKSRFCDNPIKENEFKIDPSIKYKIKEWRPYFMSILIHYYKKFLEEGLVEPDEVKKATAKYKVDNDKFNEFFDACVEEDISVFESNKVVYNNFSSWWSSNYPTSKIPEIKELRRAMKVKYGNEKEKMINGCMNYGFNVRLRERVETNDFDDNEI